MVLKPSENAIIDGKIVELIEEAGFPSGVFNVVYGAHDVVNTLLRDPLVKGISFVGSKMLVNMSIKKEQKSETSPSTNWRKNHVIVLKDANLDRAVKTLSVALLDQPMNAVWSLR